MNRFILYFVLVPTFIICLCGCNFNKQDYSEVFNKEITSKDISSKDMSIKDSTPDSDIIQESIQEPETSIIDSELFHIDVENINTDIISTDDISIDGYNYDYTNNDYDYNYNSNSNNDYEIDISNNESEAAEAESLSDKYLSEFSQLAPTTTMSFEELVGDNGIYDYPEGFPTPDTYYILVDLKQHVVAVYSKDSEGNYTIPVRYMLCSSGAASTPTMTGKFELKSYRVRFALFNNTESYAQYWSLI